MTFLITSLAARLLFFPSFAIAVACLFLAESRLYAQLQWETTTLREELALGQANSEAVFRFEKTPFPRPPVRPNGSFRGLPQKANS